MTLYNLELREKALALRGKLNNAGITAYFDESSFRDYMVMLEISKDSEKSGKIVIYYKPSKDTYSLKKQLNNTKTEKIVDEVWEKLSGAENYGAESGIYEAFVDGSYISGVTGYGAVIYCGDELKAKLSGTILDVEFRQFGGELKSVIETIKWCTENRVEKVRINYDYQGIEKFAAGLWKPKNNLSKEYVDFIKNTGIQIEWRHIKSHTGNPKNEEADSLAKKAALETPSISSKRFTDLENKALAFIAFINEKEDFFAQYTGAENGEYVKIRITKKTSRLSGIIEMIYAKTNNITIRQSKNEIESDIYNLWQEFLLFEDFNS